MQVPLRIFRYKPGGSPHYDAFDVEIPETAYVLDAIEAAWAHHDRTLMFRHACHHASCGSCAVRIDGREKLPCITTVREVWDGQSELRLEPLRNLPLVGDLVVEVGGFFQRQAAASLSITRTAESTLDGKRVELPEGLARLTRFENCIECGICLSACPTMAADDRFFGPAGLAAVYRARQETNDPQESARLLSLVDGDQGVWRCHSAWECTESCPQNVQPAEKIMALRQELTKRRLGKILGR